MTADERINALLERAGCAVMVVKSDAPPTPERHMADLIDRLEVALENALNERDAAIRDLKKIDLDCDMCVHNGKVDEVCPCDCSECGIADCICGDCINNSEWKWHGVPEVIGDE